jgi:hypothetical protein
LNPVCGKRAGCRDVIDGLLLCHGDDARREDGETAGERGL